MSKAKKFLSEFDESFNSLDDRIKNALPDKPTGKDALEALIFDSYKLGRDITSLSLLFYDVHELNRMPPGISSELDTEMSKLIKKLEAVDKQYSKIRRLSEKIAKGSK